MLEEAKRLHNLGLKVCFTKDPSKKGGKAPIGYWRDFIDGAQTIKDIEKLYKYAITQDKNLGLAIICSDGLEIIDIDSKYFLERHTVEAVYDAIINVIGIKAFESLVMVETVSGGYHLFYRSGVSTNNTKLASRYTTDEEKALDSNDRQRVLLETRAHGGIILAAPTKGYKLDNPQKDYSTIPTITDEQRNSIISVCRSFDELKETYSQSKAATPIDVSGMGKSTIDAFNEAHTCSELLEENGWQFQYERANNRHYVRPGKSLREGIGAGVDDKMGLVRIFTSSTPFQQDKTYNAFQVYAYLNEDGDYKRAWKTLYDAGYGDRLSKNQDSHKAQASQLMSGNDTISKSASNDKLMQAIYDKRLDITVKPVNKPNTLFMHCFERGEYIGLGGDGDLINFFGREKTRKSAAAACATSCFMAGGDHKSLLFNVDFDGRNILHFDTEQSEFYHHKLAGQMMHQQGLDQNEHPSNFFSFHIMPYTKIDRLNFIRYSIDKTPNIGCMFVDGVVDLCRNYNDLEEASDLVTFFMNMASKRNFLLIDVLHNARSTGSARGHLGTELLNKAQCNINVTKEEGAKHSTLEIQSIRGDSEPKGFDFWHDANGNIELYN